MKVFAMLSSIFTLLALAFDKVSSLSIPKLIRQDMLLENQNERRLLQNDIGTNILSYPEWNICRSNVVEHCLSCIDKCYTGFDSFYFTIAYKCENGNYNEYTYKKTSSRGAGFFDPAEVPTDCTIDLLGSQVGFRTLQANSACCKPNGIEVVQDKIYAVSGTFSGGLNGAEAKSLCSNGFEICSSAKRVEELGLTADMCNNGNFMKTDQEFFATLQSSNGNFICNTDSNSISTNDIWGCSKKNTVQNNADCGVLTSAIASFSNFNAWSFSDEFNEINTASITDLTSGGVLCCSIL